MAYTKATCDLDSSQGRQGLAQRLGLRNVGFSVHILARGEGYDFFHNHREQEEVYFCVEGAADILIGTPEQHERVILQRGDAIRLDPGTLRAVGNLSSDRAIVVIAGACPHPYPAGTGHHDVISDVASVVGKGTTGFNMPPSTNITAPQLNDEDC